MRLIPQTLVVAAFATASFAQVQQFSGTPANPDFTLDFDAPFVSSGAISSTSNAFTSNGIASCTLVGTWTTGTDAITAGSNGSGQSLVSQGNGTMSVAGIGAPLDNVGTGGGFEIVLLNRCTDFGVLFVDQINFSYQVELLDGTNSLGVGAFSYSGAYPQPAHYWRANGVLFDRIRLSLSGSIGAGVGIDNFAIAGSVTAPVTYCTAGTSTTGCAATIGASAQPSATLTTPCVISVSGVTAQQSGIVFYGVNNTGWVPLTWATGSTSFLCVKPTTQRSPAQSSGGTSGLCDGSFALDWNQLHTTFPGLLGTPFSVGLKVYAQGWYRDPPAPKTTNLSDAVELTLGP